MGGGGGAIDEGDGGRDEGGQLVEALFDLDDLEFEFGCVVGVGFGAEGGERGDVVFAFGGDGEGGEEVGEEEGVSTEKGRCGTVGWGRGEDLAEVFNLKVSEGVRNGGEGNETDHIQCWVVC